MSAHVALSRAPLHRIFRSAVAVVAGAVVAVGVTAAPATAVAYPATPTGVRVVSSTATSITLTASRAVGATGYRLFASTTKSDVYVANIARAKRSGIASSPTVSISSLPYSTSTWYFRYGAVNSAGTRYSADVFSANLKPGIPSSLVVRSSSTGTLLTWSSGAALGYRIAQSTDPGMQANRVNYRITSQAKQFTPYGVKRGTRYYFRVSSVNGSSASSYSTMESAVAVPTEQNARVMTYNVLGSSTVGYVEGDGPLAPWSQRREGVARLIRGAGADLVAVQEGGGWVTKVEGYGGVRQVDDLAGMLTSSSGPAYGLAATEIPPSVHGYMRTGNYILYNKATYAPVGTGGHWSLGGHGAAYQVLRSRATGARLLFVSAHLSPTGGTTGEAERTSETKSLISQATALGKSQGVPVVYAGDFNSHGGGPAATDGPGLAFTAAHVSNARQVAQTFVNANYNSANQNRHVPMASGLSIDHVYAPAGVAVRSWHLWLELTQGLFTGTLPSDHNPLSVEVTFPAMN
jgi:endonuclease/exonuclease/phosphatase family metal-dependent hydrolase